MGISFIPINFSKIVETVALNNLSKSWISWNIVSSDIKFTFVNQNVNDLQNETLGPNNSFYIHQVLK